MSYDNGKLQINSNKFYQEGLRCSKISNLWIAMSCYSISGISESKYSLSRAAVMFSSFEQLLYHLNILPALFLRFINARSQRVCININVRQRRF